MALQDSSTQVISCGLHQLSATGLRRRQRSYVCFCEAFCIAHLHNHQKSLQLLQLHC
jgi:hypothetical protein